MTGHTAQGLQGVRPAAERMSDQAQALVGEGVTDYEDSVYNR